MAKIIPLSGVRYHLDQVGDLEKVIAPPYDVISPELQDQLYSKSPYNIVRIDFGKEYADDSETNNRYTRAAKLYQEWKEQGVLIREDQPAYYVYCQDFEVKGVSYSRIGFLCLTRLEELGSSVHPHERTLSGPKEDRLKLMRACNAAFSPVFSLYPGEGQGSVHIRKAVENLEPLTDFVDADGIRNRFWLLTDPAAIQKISEFMNDQDLFIADGHHRYETALNYRNGCKAANPNHTGDEPYNYVLMMLVDMGDPGLAVLPTHRLVRRPEGIDAKQLVASLEPSFQITSYSDLEALISDLEKSEGKQQAFAIFSKETGYQLAVLKDASLLDRVMPAGHSEAWRNLDVNLLHYTTLVNQLGIGPERWEDSAYMAYTRDEDEAVKRVDSGEFQIAFFLTRTSVKQVRMVSDAGERMPQKSTYFYPKVLTGLVLNDFSFKFDFSFSFNFSPG